MRSGIGSGTDCTEEPGAVDIVADTVAGIASGRLAVAKENK